VVYNDPKIIFAKAVLPITILSNCIMVKTHYQLVRASVKLDMDKKEISFNINGTDYGVAFSNIRIDTELCLCVLLCKENDSIEIV